MVKCLGLFIHLKMSYLLAEFSRGSERNGHSVYSLSTWQGVWAVIKSVTEKLAVGSRINKIKTVSELLFPFARLNGNTVRVFRYGY